MRNVIFWVFQVVVLAGAIGTFWFVMESTREPATAAKQADSGVVLSEQVVDFYQSPASVMDPNEVHDIVNDQRRATDLPALRKHAGLTAEARRRAISMQDQLYYAHEDPETGETFVNGLRSADVSYSFACENLNMAFSSKSYLTVRDWLTSNKGHRECLQHDLITHAGYAVVDVPLADEKSVHVVVAIYAAL